MNANDAIVIIVLALIVWLVAWFMFLAYTSPFDRDRWARWWKSRLRIR